MKSPDLAPPKYGTHRYKRLTKADRGALEHSVARYTGYAKLPPTLVVDGEHAPDLGRHACRLCRLHYYKDCDGCPIAHNTGTVSCERTPYFPESLTETGLPCLLISLASKIRYAQAGLDAPSCYRSLLRRFRQRCREQAEFMQRLLDNDPGPHGPKKRKS